MKKEINDQVIALDALKINKQPLVRPGYMTTLIQKQVQTLNT